MAVALIVLCAVTLFSCGGDEKSGVAVPRGETQEILVMLKRAAKEDPSNCVRLQTLRFTEQTTKERGEAAIHACEGEMREGGGLGLPDSMAIEADGRTASVRAFFRGGGLDGQALEFALVKRAGRWKFDRIVRFLRMKRARLIAELAAEMVRRTSSRPGLEAVECVIGRLEGFDGAGLEHLVLGRTSRPLVELVESCGQPGPAAQVA